MSLNEIDCRVVFDLECTFGMFKVCFNPFFINVTFTGVKKSHLLTYNDTDAIQCNFVKVFKFSNQV